MKATVIDEILFSAFNYDVFDGTGPSGFTLDLTKVNSYEIKYFWNGCGILEFYVNGYLGHTIENFNLSEIYTRTISLPLSYKIFNTSITTSSYFKVFSSSVHTDSIVNNGLTFSAFLQNKNITTTEVPILSIRAASLFSSLTNRIISLPKNLFITTETNRIIYKLVYNPTLTGASFISVNSDSSVEYDISSTSYSGGSVIFFGSLANTTDSILIDISNFFDIYERAVRLDGFATSSSVLSVVAANTVAGNARVRSTLTWTEV